MTDVKNSVFANIEQFKGRYIGFVSDTGLTAYMLIWIKDRPYAYDPVDLVIWTNDQEKETKGTYYEFDTPKELFNWLLINRP